MPKPLDVKYLYYSVNQADEPSIYKATAHKQGLLLFSWATEEVAKAEGLKLSKLLGVGFEASGPRLTSSKTQVAFEVHTQHD